jgi:hypothetical protein
MHQFGCVFELLLLWFGICCLLWFRFYGPCHIRGPSPGGDALYAQTDGPLLMSSQGCGQSRIPPLIQGVPDAWFTHVAHVGLTGFQGD